jgi:hypothetical protein
MIDEQRMKSILQKERDLLSVEHIRKLQRKKLICYVNKKYICNLQLRKKESNDKRG